MSVKRFIPLFLLLFLLLSACQSRESALFRENFADAPARVSGAPDNVPPSLDEGHLPEIIAACKQSGISSPRFLSDDAPRLTARCSREALISSWKTARNSAARISSMRERTRSTAAGSRPPRAAAI